MMPKLPPCPDCNEPLSSQGFGSGYARAGCVCGWFVWVPKPVEENQ